MKTPMTLEQIERTFERNQKELTLDDAGVLWCGDYVQLYKRNHDNTIMGSLTTMSASSNIVLKIKTWCVKNAYRCSQIKNEKVVL